MQKIKDSNQEYHSHNSISASGLKTIYKKSVFHHLNQKPFTSASMNFGSAVHSVLLEDSTDELATLPEDLNLKTIKGREAKEKFIKDNPDKIVITYKENNNIQKIIKNYRQNDLAMEILFSLTEKEISYYGKIDNIDCRIRPDGIKENDFVMDIKTCQDGSPGAFRKAIYYYSYHLQACFYSEALGFKPENFRFIAIENQHPFSVVVYSMSDDMIESGKLAWRTAFKQWKKYKQTGVATQYTWDNKNNDGSLIL